MNEYLSLKNHVYNYISEKINNGSLHPYDKINELQISKELNVSRTPVREALIQLASDGYLENLPRRGFKVKQIDEKTAKEIYEIIGPLDGQAAKLSINYITDEDISQMLIIKNTMEEAIEKSQFEKYHELQLAFHDIYTNKCENDQLISLINQIKKNFMKKQYTSDNTESIIDILKITNKEHIEIIDLFKEKNGDKIQDYIRDVHWGTEKARFDTW